MKRLSLFALVITVTLASCGKLDMNLIDDIVSASKTTIASEELPENITTVLNDDYFGTYIEEALLADGLGYQINLSNETEVFFDKNGEGLNEKNDKKRKKGGKGCDKGEKIDIENLPAGIATYISDNYPDVTIERAKINHDDKYMVKVTGDLILVFDAEGNFIEEHEFMDNHGHDNKVEITDLPTAITDYITANYSDATIKVAFLKGDKYLVGLTTDSGRTMLVFDSEGVFIEEKTCNG